MPGSDGAGEVIEVGSKVVEFKKGDHVATLFNQGHQYGEIDTFAAGTGLGGVIDGALREYGVFNEQGLVKAPKNLDAREASTLPCAALTSWNALYGLKPLKPGQVVLVQGTGGVSMFGLQVSTELMDTSSEWTRLTQPYSSPKLLARQLLRQPLLQRRLRSSRSSVPITLSITRLSPTGVRLLAS